MDKNRMEEKIFQLPEQIEEAVELTEKARIELKGEPQKIVVAGMGGSAMAGDILRTVLWDRFSLPIEVVRSYSLPAFVDEKTLLIVVSYSGNTEETLACLAHGKKVAKMIQCVSSGGELSTIAAQESMPLVKIPAGYPPRSAIGYLTVPLLLAVRPLGVDLSSDIEETAEVLRSMRDELSSRSEENVTRRLAAGFVGKVPVVYSSYEYGVVTFRWRTQLNENSEVWTHTNLLPEMNHNEIVGIGIPPEVCRRCSVIFLRDPDELDRIKMRTELTKEIITPLVAGVTELWARGSSTLAKLFSLIYYGDWTSLHLAFERGVDPTPVERIDYLKDQLSRKS